MRFPEFSGEWNKCTINDLATVVGGGTPDTTVKSYWGGDIQWFTPSEIGKNKYVDFSLRTITRDGLDNSSAKLLPLHTILLSSRATVGECSIASNECTTNQGFQSLIAKQCNIDFLYYLIQTKKKDLIRNACGSTFLEISANEIRKIKVAVPVQNEQEQIAKLLSLIDERIATQNKIIE
ncbi:restriction endonuclease subunit S, partial [Alistipes dispar]|uniref:restriction endonuclease subunit S n=1 Tax=Alistipes dispar TaxID=2585119 RepID=UPI0029431107